MLHEARRNIITNISAPVLCQISEVDTLLDAESTRTAHGAHIRQDGTPTNPSAFQILSFVSCKRDFVRVKIYSSQHRQGILGIESNPNNK